MDVVYNKHTPGHKTRSFSFPEIVLFMLPIYLSFQRINYERFFVLLLLLLCRLQNALKTNKLKRGRWRLFFICLFFSTLFVAFFNGIN